MEKMSSGLKTEVMVSGMTWLTLRGDLGADAPVLVWHDKEGTKEGPSMHKLVEREIGLEDHLREAQRQTRIAEGLAQVYGGMKKVRDELQQRRAEVEKLEVELTMVQRLMDEQIYGKDGDKKTSFRLRPTGVGLPPHRPGPRSHLRSSSRGLQR